MLTRGTSRFREWGLFAASALIPALAMGAIGLRALRNEEAAVKREMTLQVAASAEESASAFRTALDQLDTGAPFADRVTVAAAEMAQTESVASSNKACRALLLRAQKGERSARAQILDECATAQSPTGRMMWPMFALLPDGASVETLARWLDDHGTSLAGAELAATRHEIASATWFNEGERQRLAAKLSTPSDGSATRALWASQRQAMLAGRETISWQEREAVGTLRRQPDGSYVGFVVHPGSIARAMKSGWPPLPPTMRATLASSPEHAAAIAPAVSHTVELLPSGPVLVVSVIDPGSIARRSFWLLLATAVLAGALAIALAALLFARMRRERHLGALRTDFVAAVSHELRTPIASLQMLSELLAEGKVEPDERDEMLAALAREARRLGSTVHRLLSFSRMEAGKQRANLARVAIDELALGVVAGFEQRFADAAPIACDVEAITTDADAEALAMALENLLLNARKYAPDGKPYALSVSAVGDEVCIAVRDEGPGVQPRDQKRIFKPFERADDRLSEATEGSGIGLSLVRHVAEAHGGRVTLDSQPGHGATFTIWIPKA